MNVFGHASDPARPAQVIWIVGEARHNLTAKQVERFDQMHACFDDMHDRMLVQTRWLIGSLALIGTVVSVLLAIGQFVK